MNNEGYHLSRAFYVREIVTADYITGGTVGHPHTHRTAWELCCCLGGSLTLVRGNKKLVLNKGDIALAGPQARHAVYSDPVGAEVFVISFTCLGDQLRALQESVIHLDDDQLRLFYKIISEISHGFVLSDTGLRCISFTPSAESPFGAEQMICNYLEQIIITMLRKVTMQDGQIIRTAVFKTAIQGYLIEQVQAYIEENLHRRLVVEEIADRFHYSRARLSTIFKANTGYSINEFITNKRMERAKLLLEEGRLSVAQISDQLGYPSPQYFTNKFHTQVGCPPSKYAASLRNK